MCGENTEIDSIIVREPPNYGGRAAVLSRRDTSERIRWTSERFPRRRIYSVVFHSLPRNAAAEDSRPPSTDGITSHCKIAGLYDFSPRTCGYTLFTEDSEFRLESGRNGCRRSSPIGKCPRILERKRDSDFEIYFTRSPGPGWSTCRFPRL